MSRKTTKKKNSVHKGLNLSEHLQEHNTVYRNFNEHYFNDQESSRVEGLFDHDKAQVGNNILQEL